MKEKLNIKKLIISLVIPLAVAGVSALISHSGMEAYESTVKPALTPPSAAFPIVWSILFVLMGIALYLVWNADAPASKKRIAVVDFILQLAANFLWTLIFFGFGNYSAAFICLIILWVFILITLIGFYRIKPAAGWLMLPYLLWATFAGYLNFIIIQLN